MDLMENKKEIWKPLTNYEQYYLVSNTGRVKSLSFSYSDKNGVLYNRKGKILNQKTDKRGYHKVTLSQTNKKYYCVHELVALMFVGKKPKGLEINHKDGIKANNSFDNLEYVTRGQNIKHAYDNLLRKKLTGKSNHKSKLVLDKLTGVFYESCNEASNYSIYKSSSLRSQLNGSKRNNTNLIYC